MRVVQLLRKLNATEWGGTETAIQRLVDGLRAHGVTPVVYCPRMGETNDLDQALAGCEVSRFNAFIPVVGLSKERKREMVAVGGNLMSFDLIAALWRERNVSVIHTHTLGRIGGIGLTIAKQRRIPFVVTIHGGVHDLPEKIKKEFNTPIAGGWEWGKLFGLLFQSHRLFRDADAIITCNPNEAALLQERYKNKHIVVQAHGVPIQLYRQDQRQAARAAFPAIRGKQVLLSVGRIDPIKNQAWLLEQASIFLQRHPHALLVLAGACTNEPYGVQIEKQLKSLGLNGQVLLTGGLPSADPRLIGLFQEAQAVILPSLSETFGLVILEAWAAGTVPLASRTSGASALIEQGVNGFLFDLAQPSSFHSALDQVLANRDFARQLALQGGGKVESDYSSGVIAGRLKQLYDSLVEEKACAT
jgi:glycosyltransferase involved in cell wall biosynthesis